MPLFYYVCDRCGDILTITEGAIPADESWTCENCGSQTAWQFTDKDHARDHSAHIRDAARRGTWRDLS